MGMLCESQPEPVSAHVALHAVVHAVIMSLGFLALAQHLFKLVVCGHALPLREALHGAQELLFRGV